MASRVIVFQDKLAPVGGDCTVTETSCSETERRIARTSRGRRGEAIDVHNGLDIICPGQICCDGKTDLNTNAPLESI